MAPTWTMLFTAGATPGWTRGSATGISNGACPPSAFQCWRCKAPTTSTALRRRSRRSRGASPVRRRNCLSPARGTRRTSTGRTRSSRRSAGSFARKPSPAVRRRGDRHIQHAPSSGEQEVVGAELVGRGVEQGDAGIGRKIDDGVGAVGDHSQVAEGVETEAEQADLVLAGVTDDAVVVVVAPDDADVRAGAGKAALAAVVERPAQRDEMHLDQRRRYVAR